MGDSGLSPMKNLSLATHEVCRQVRRCLAPCPCPNGRRAASLCMDDHHLMHPSKSSLPTRCDGWGAPSILVGSQLWSRGLCANLRLSGGEMKGVRLPRTRPQGWNDGGSMKRHFPCSAAPTGLRRTTADETDPHLLALWARQMCGHLPSDEDCRTRIEAAGLPSCPTPPFSLTQTTAAPSRPARVRFSCGGAAGREKATQMQATGGGAR